MGLRISRRARTWFAVSCVLVSITFIALFLVGQELSADPELDVSGIAAGLYPGSWPPIARGLLWLFVAATAVGFDLFIVYPRAETRAGRAGVATLAVLAGTSFGAFAIGSFAGASWSVIH